MARKDLANIFEDRFGSWDIKEGKVVGHSFEIYVPRHARNFQNCLHLRGKRYSRTFVEVKQRLLANSIARQDEFAVSTIPNGNRKHSAQAFETALAFFLI